MITAKEFYIQKKVRSSFEKEDIIRNRSENMSEVFEIMEIYADYKMGKGKRTSMRTNRKPMTPKQIRKDLGLTQSELANKLGVSRKTVSKYENQPPPKWYVVALHGVEK